jgi:hypothetical protein
VKALHLALALFSILVVVKRRVWREWQMYQPTMMLFALGNVTYNFLTANYFLWKMKPDFFPNHSITEMVYSFVIFPASALLFLSNYPTGTRKIFWYYVKWIAVYVIVEWFFTTNGRMLYQHGWNLWWSFAFDITMFPILRLHHKRPLIAYSISVFLCVFWVWMFDVPVDVPIEQRTG